MNWHLDVERRGPRHKVLGEATKYDGVHAPLRVTGKSDDMPVPECSGANLIMIIGCRSPTGESGGYLEFILVLGPRRRHV
jgi:hypothetical protein